MDKNKCEICGSNLKEDLFSSVTNDPVCSICKIKYIGGLPTTHERIQAARVLLGLANGEYLVQNKFKEASRILGKI